MAQSNLLDWAINQFFTTPEDISKQFYKEVMAALVRNFFAPCSM